MKLFGQLQEHYQTTGTTRNVQKGTPLAELDGQPVHLSQEGQVVRRTHRDAGQPGRLDMGTTDDRWQKMFGWAEKYYEDNGTVYAPYDYRTPDGKSLYAWNRNQLLQYSKNRLSAERIEKLTTWATGVGTRPVMKRLIIGISLSQ